MKKRIKFMNILAGVTIITALLILLHVGYLLMWPYKPAEFLNNPFPVQDSIVKQGGRLCYYVEYHKLMDVPVTTQSMLVDHTQISFPPTSSRLPKGEYELINNDVFIPEYVTPGKAYISIIFTFRVNSIRDIVISARTEEFEIVPK